MGYYSQVYLVMKETTFDRFKKRAQRVYEYEMKRRGGILEDDGCFHYLDGHKASKDITKYLTFRKVGEDSDGYALYQTHDCVKWYDSYPEIIAYTKAMNDSKYAIQFLRIGEERDDVEEAFYGVEETEDLPRVYPYVSVDYGNMNMI